jgi:hypothetical protein
MSQRIVGCGDAPATKGYFAALDSFQASADTLRISDRLLTLSERSCKLVKRWSLRLWRSYSESHERITALALTPFLPWCLWIVVLVIAPSTRR